MSKTSLYWKSVPITKVDVVGWNTLIDQLNESWGPPTPPRPGHTFRTTWYDTT